MERREKEEGCSNWELKWTLSELDKGHTGLCYNIPTTLGMFIIQR